MKRLAFAVAVLVLGLVGTAQAQSWDLAGDWPAQLSDGTLPLPAKSGDWSYGYALLWSKATTNYVFTLWPSTKSSQFGLMNDGIYYRDGNDPFPFVGKNLGHAWPNADIPVGAIGGHSWGGTGNTTVPFVFRWTAPQDLLIRIDVQAWVGYMPGTETASDRSFNIGIKKNGTAPVAQAYVPRVGDLMQSDNKTSLTLYTSVKAGDKVDLFGYCNDVTPGLEGYMEHISVVPEPGSLLALSSGLLAFAGLALKRRR